MLGQLDDLAAAVEALGADAKRVGARLPSLPGELATAREAVEETARLTEERRGVAAGAAADVADDARARRESVRAGDRLRAAERKLAHAREEAARLEGEADRLHQEAEELPRRAHALAGRMRERPGLAAAAGAPGDTPEAAGPWATEARAALLVARSGLAAEREALIRQANELGSLVLGEPLAARTPADVARLLAPEATD